MGKLLFKIGKRSHVTVTIGKPYSSGSKLCKRCFDAFDRAVSIAVCLRGGWGQVGVGQVFKDVLRGGGGWVQVSEDLSRVLEIPQGAEGVRETVVGRGGNGAFNGGAEGEESSGFDTNEGFGTWWEVEARDVLAPERLGVIGGHGEGDTQENRAR